MKFNKIEDDYTKNKQLCFEEMKEFPLPRNFILYSEIKYELDKIISVNSDIMKLEQIGISALGNPLYVIFISERVDNLDTYKDKIHNSIRNPLEALDFLKKDSEYFKVTIFMNCSCHGIEVCGVDAGFRVLNYLAYNKEDLKIKQILKNSIMILNICANPDGRIRNMLNNGHNIDLNRDSFTVSQPEISNLNNSVRFNYFPNSTLDVHGFWAEFDGDADGLFDCCTEPHNPNTEYKLQEAINLEAGLNNREIIKKQTDLTVKLPTIDYKKEGWDDYTPVFNGNINSLTGGIGHTLEVNYFNDEGSEMGFISFIGLCNFVSNNKIRYLESMFNSFLNGVEEKDNGHIKFPKYYVIPLENSEQNNLSEAIDVINKLLDFKVIVKKSTKKILISGKEYKENLTYVVDMKQALRGIANNYLWEGEDITEKIITLYDISIYSMKLFYNINVIKIEDIGQINFNDQKLEEIQEHINKIEINNKIDRFIIKINNDNINNQFYYYAIEYINNESIIYNNKLNEYINLKEGRNYSNISNFQILMINNSPYFIYSKTNLTDEYIKFNNPFSNYFIIDEQTLRSKSSQILKELKIPDLNIILKYSSPIRYVHIGDNGGICEVMKSWGYNVKTVTMEMLNRGFELKHEEFDGLIISGHRKSFYMDSQPDQFGITWGQSYGLHKRAKRIINSFAKNVKYILGCGYAGAATIKELKIEGFDFGFFEGATESEQQMNNGIFNISLDNKDVTCLSFNQIEKFYLWLPVWFKLSGDNFLVTGRYTEKNSFYKGFCKYEEKILNQPVIIRNKPNSGSNIVLIGFDPGFRLYVPCSYRLIYNTLTYFNRIN